MVFAEMSKNIGGLAVALVLSSHVKEAHVAVQITAFSPNQST
jgi:hypothetical protein